MPPQVKDSKRLEDSFLLSCRHHVSKKEVAFLKGYLESDRDER